MKRPNARSDQQLWSFIKDHAVTLTTVLTGIVVTVAIRFQSFSLDVFVKVNLGLTILLVTSELVARAQKLAKLEEIIENNHDEVLRQIGSVRSLHFSTAQDAFSFMSEQIMAAERSIYHFAMANAVPYGPAEKNPFERAIAKTIQAGKVNYHYVAKLPNERREKRIRALMAVDKGARLFVKSLNSSSETYHNFMVFDDETVILNTPYEYGADTAFVVIKDAQVANFYKSYFQHVWKVAAPYQPTAS